MQTNFCKTCGGNLIREGSHFICRSCGNRWVVDAADDVNAVERSNAWTALRDGEFDRAAELFELIREKEPKDHEAYWGLALALAGILYVTDYQEHKRVPTCNSISEDSFLDSKNVRRAIELAPKEIAEGYRQQAEQIERIRVEWMEKASKEEPYDIFLSFKDSDKEHGIERTEDSKDAETLYHVLTQKGYRVFFSRVSLYGKLSEHYEPYIYNALHTAQVMIVFGEKPEYFNATWVRNEWNRFRKRIEAGQKHEKSLLVAFKNMSANDLPVALRARQSLEVDNMGLYLEPLLSHINRVIQENAAVKHLDKERRGGKIGKKEDKIAKNTITQRSLGQNVSVKTSVDEKRLLVLVETHIREKQWEEAEALVNKVMFDNPSSAEAIWCKLLIKHKMTSNSTLMRVVDRFKPEDFATIEQVLDCASVEFAGKVLDLLYQSCKLMPTHVREKVYDVILPYSYERRDQRLKENFEWCIANREFKTFQLLLTALDESAVDAYIDYVTQYLKSTLDHQEKRACTDMILKVHEGNRDALMYIFESELSTATELEPILNAFKEVLAYSQNMNADVIEAIVMATAVLNAPLHCQFAEQLPGFYQGDPANLRRPLMMLAGRMLEKSFFDSADKIYGTVLSADETDAEAFWGLCLAKTRSTSEEKITASPILLESLDEYTKYLSLVSQERCIQCMRLAKTQKTAQKSKRRKRIRAIVLVSAAAVLVAGSVTAFTVVLPTVRLNKADQMFASGDYSGANAIYQQLDGFGDSHKRAETVKAILQVQAGSYANAVNTLLAAGVPVEIVYQAEGGSFAGTDALVLGHTLSTDSSLIPLNTPTGATEATTTRTYNTSADFTGLLTPAREGYRFVSWEQQSFSYDIDSHNPVFRMVLKATWSTQEYVINYHLEGGTVNGTNPVEYGVESEDITLIEPTRPGYNFLGWTWEGQTTPTKGVTIPKGSIGDRIYTANWQAQEFKILLDLNDGSGTVNEMKVMYDQAFTLPIPERAGYQFAGWYDAATETLFSDGVWTRIGDRSLKAHWVQIDYEISYHLGGGVNAEGNPATYTCEQECTLAQPTRVGYAFLGWSLTENGEIVGQDISWTRGEVGNKDFYANWSALTATVTLDAAGGSCPTTQMTVTYDETLTLPVPTWNGRSFSGWFLGGERVTDGICAITGDCTLVAHWDAYVYNITYHLDGGSNALENPATYTGDDTVVLHAPTRTGYCFLGWTYSGQATPVTSVTIPHNSMGDKVFTAHWEKARVTVSFDAAGGTCNVSTMNVTYGEQWTLPTPQWAGHNFLGWYENNTPVTGGVSDMVTDRTLTAKWESISYTITYSNLQNGVNPAENRTTYTYDHAFTLVAPTRQGYTFLGWTYEGQNTPVETVTIAAGTIGNKTFNAEWEVNTYTIELNPAGGSVDVPTMEQTYGEAYSLPIPTRPGYSFTGWYWHGELVDNSGTWLKTDDGELIAGWAEGHYVVTLRDTQDSDGIRYEQGSTATLEVVFGENLTLPTPERTGYTFLGWYNGATLVESGEWIIDADVELTPDWDAISYEITLDANGGILHDGETPVSTMTLRIIYDDIYTLPTPIQDGKTLAGWYCYELDEWIPAAGTWTWAPESGTLSLEAEWF